MKYLLMHKSKPVAELDIDPLTNAIIMVGEIYAAAHIPPGAVARDGQIDRRELNRWWMGRGIPASRAGLREALEALQATTDELLEKCHGLSLSDQYWMNTAAKPLNWEKVNFFDNPFSQDVGRTLFGEAREGELDLISPDNTSDGWLRKKWVIADGERLLVKGGSGPNLQEPLNELLATAILRRLGVEHTRYDLIFENGQPYSVCRDFVNRDTDFISAWHISETLKRENHVSKYQHYLKCCAEMGIPSVADGLDRMMVLDYIIGNTDRHYNNFGAVRNADTLEWHGSAPIFDSGTSMWHDQLATKIKPKEDVASKPFRGRHSEQIELVQSFEWMGIKDLKGIEEEYSEILKKSPYIEEDRRTALCYGLQCRVEMISKEREKHFKLSIPARLEEAKTLAGLHNHATVHKKSEVER